MAISNTQILNALYAVAPQFANPDSATLERYETLIGLLRCQVNENATCCAALLYAYLLAHMLSTTPQTGAASSLSEGDLSISFATSSDSSVLAGTSYGRAYLDLVKRTVQGSTVTNLPPGYSVNYYSGTSGCGCGC